MTRTPRKLEDLEQSVQDFLKMLAVRRPANSPSEKLFNKQWLDCLPGMTIDPAGNRILRVGGEPGTETFYPVLWSSHTDTVHNSGGYQKLTYEYEHDRRVAFLSEAAIKEGSNCLGADCTAGVWLMREMILAGVPGLYIFHAGEEIGGIGSSYIADTTPELLNGIMYAIAFDRRGYESVITHQGTRCASDTFAKAFAQLLGNDYEPDDGGLFTDTANYTDLIPECTNISVGYSGAHTKTEQQDVGFLLWLRDKMLEIGGQITSLPAVRNPKKDHDVPATGGWWTRYSRYKSTTITEHRWSSYLNETVDDGNSVADSGDFRDMKELVEFFPEIAARLLLEAGISPGEFKANAYS